jgi:hypothetical protein
VDHDNTQSLEEKLQQQASSLLARRFSSIESEVQRLQSSINEFCERLLTYASNKEVSTDEISDLNTQLRQTLSAESDRASSQAVADALAQAEAEYQQKLTEAEAQINELRAQLATSQQASMAAVAPLAAVPAAPSGRFDLLHSAILELDAQRTQAEALTTLVKYAAHFAPRIIFFVLKGGNAIGWKASGFANGLNDETARSLTVAVPSVTLLREAIEQQRTASASAETSDDIAALLGSYGAPRPDHAVTIPLTVRGKAAAVLYGDSGTQDGNEINTAALESLLHVTSLVVELLPVRKSTEQVRPAAPQPQPVASQPVARPAPEPPVQPTAPTPQPAPVFYGGLGDEQPTRTETPAPSEQAAPAFASAAPTSQAAPVITAAPTTPEAPVSLASAPAAQPIEKPPTAPEPAPAAATTPLSSSSGQAQKSGAILPGNASESEVRAHNDARRFARLLVSEIKLYNEARVADGRRSHDLYERLKEDIDRSRQMYEKRVPPSVASRYDYFYDELVHTLAEGDPSKLGHGCPGPTVPIN